MLSWNAVMFTAKAARATGSGTSGASGSHALDLGDGGVDRVVGNRREAAEAPGLGRAEVGQPLVVDAHHFHGGLGIVEPAAGAEHAVEDLGLHAVAVLVLHAQLGIGEAADALLAVVVEPG